MKIGIVQENLVVGDFEGNVDLLAAGIERVRDAGAELAVCSELAICGYPPRDLVERSSFVDGNLRAVEALAARCSIPAIVGFVARADHGRGVENAAAVLDGGRIAAVRAKSLLPTYDVFDESRYFVATERREPVLIGDRKIGITICEDAWNHDELPSERRYDIDPIAELAAAGAEFIVNLSASPFALDKRALRRRIFSAQARTHKVPIVLVNQVGGNDDLLFEGGSCVYDVRGEVSAQAGEFDSDTLVADIANDGTASGPKRKTAAHDAAGDVDAAYRALVLGTRDYARKCGFKTALIGISGGIDSALVATIAADALGADNVWGLAMPSRYSSEGSVTDARALAENLGIHYLEIGIERPFSAFLDCLEPVLGRDNLGVTEENLQARSRGVLLMALSNHSGHLLLTTGNKSELAVGYCTLYGDMSGGLAVISDAPKTLVYRLAAHANKSGERIPVSTLEKPPSAELRPDQKDSDSLPPYDVLDDILERYVEGGASRADLCAAGHAAETVDLVLSLVRRSEYKRYQAAPGLKITAKAFGPGRRMPLAARWREGTGDDS